MSGLYLCSFASPDLIKSVRRFTNQAKEIKIYNDLKVYSYSDLSDQKKKQIKELNLKKKRLFGYASWKPEIIFDYLKIIPNDSILQYSDIGCHLNKDGVERLRYYKDITNEKNILAFQYFKPNFQNEKKIRYQIYYENEYTKNDLFNYLNIPENSTIRKSEQVWSGSMFIKNNKFTRDFLKKWIDICNVNHLIDDSPSKTENSLNFIEHRHDQSVFSILSKMHNAYFLSASECEWAEDDAGRYWEHLKFFPILAKRDKKMNIFKRFFNRQAKNLKKFINYE